MIGWVDSTGRINGINSVILDGSLSLFFHQKIVKISKPAFKKTCFLHMQNQRPKSAAR